MMYFKILLTKYTDKTDFEVTSCGGRDLDMLFQVFEDSKRNHQNTDPIKRKADPKG